jgi:hypothetical protein
VHDGTHNTSVGGVQEFVPKGLRLVQLRQKDLGSADELGRALRQHPRARFAVVCEAPPAPDEGSALARLQQLSGESGYTPVLTGVEGCMVFAMKERALHAHPCFACHSEVPSHLNFV